ncbi:restriction endonuclease subunit S [Allokutzneria albata]|uniref:restriction endonuclease subunit S n=1 Tax=Allokutzneria albata TaxID=211114 RepID=UPI0006945FE0|nr:restriction endonuclease subunit S [Allokutzneria albata]
MTLRTNRRIDGFTESLKEIGYQGVRIGELVIHSMDGFAGAMGVSDSNGKMSPVVHIYAVPDDNPYYVAHALRVAADSGFIQSLAKGIRERSTSFDKLTFKDMVLPRPPRSEQDAIVAYLNRETARIDTLIKEQQRLIGLLGERRTAITEGQLLGSDWSVPLRSVASLIQTGPFGSQLKSDEYIDRGIPVINPSHIAAGVIRPDAKVTVSKAKAEELARHALHIADIVAARRGELGRCAVVDAGSAGYLCGTGSALIRLDGDRVDPHFIALVFSSRRNRDALSLASVGSTMDNLNADIIGALRVPVPALDEQRRVVAAINGATSKIDTLIAETERFIELSKERRAALITAAVTGQIDVREVA